MVVPNFDISEFDDPAPAVVVDNDVHNDDHSEEETEVKAPISSKQTSRRKLPYRADISVEGKKYKGKRVSRGDAELDEDTMGIITGDQDHHSKLVPLQVSDESSDTGDRESEVSDDSNVVDGKIADSKEEQFDVEERRVSSRLAATERKEAEKARVVRVQKSLYDGVLDMRIRLEPLASLARKFPSSDQRRRADGWQLGSDISSAMGGAEKAMSLLVESMQSSWVTAWASDDDVVDDAHFEGWRNSVLDMWGKKVAEAEGIVPQGGFKTIDTTVTAQMKAALSTGKHLNRTRKVRQEISLLGCDVELPQGVDNMHFDDGEFYRTLLREIIENGEADGGGLRYAQLSKAGRVKKKINRRASKGRRLRYDVHEKLVGFLAPIPLPDPGPVDEIVAALFGKR